MKKSTAKIGNVVLTYDELASLCEQGKIYIVSGSKIYQLAYSNASEMFYGILVYTNMDGTLTKRGRFFAYNGKQVNDLVGFELLREK